MIRMKEKNAQKIEQMLIGGGKKYLSINGLRAYAALGIVAMHVLANTSVKPTECLMTKSVIGTMGELVLLFMMVSAFGMCCGYYERVRAGQMRPSNFYKKRYMRVLPFFALLVCLDLALSPSWASVAEGFSDVTLVFCLYPEADIKVIGVGWFLGAIFVFYMLFPFFTFLLDSKRRAWIVLLLAVVWQMLMAHYYHAVGNNQILYTAPYFIVGGLIYLYRESIATLFEKRSLSKWIGLAVCLLLTAVFYTVPSVHETFFGRDLPRLILYAAWLSYAVGTSQWLLNNRLTAYLSGISMEIYLCHMVMFRMVEKVHIERFVADNNLNYITTLALTLIGAIIFSHIVKYRVLPKVTSKIVAVSR